MPDSHRLPRRHRLVAPSWQNTRALTRQLVVGSITVRLWCQLKGWSMSKDTGTKPDTLEGLGEQDRYSAYLRAAQGGDRSALDVLVAELTPLVWHVARGGGLDRNAAEDVVQTVWLTLLRHLDRLAESRALVGWLITTTRREARRARAYGAPPASAELVIDDSPLSGQSDQYLWVAFQRLPQRCQELLRLTVLAGRAEYRVVADALNLPLGSIGPTRGRCLNALRALFDEVIAEVRVDVPSDISTLRFLDEEKVPQVAIPTEPDADDLTIPITIYLADEAGHERVEAELEVLLRTAGLEMADRDDPVLGSWFRRMRARTRDVARSPIAGEAAAVAMHAVESRGVLAHDANVTATLMQNLGPLLTSLQSTKDAVIRVGALLVVKVEWVVAVHQLTSVQQLRLDHQPHLLTSPRDILHALHLSSDPATPSLASSNGKWIPSGEPGDRDPSLTRGAQMITEGQGGHPEQSQA
ncbi:putative RNA polymerase sigma factor [Alloactinosynnema sp. L-07]|nr:putative RNA polymerase sigma factor [Alloactinosynnema sp. L-07]